MFETLMWIWMNLEAFSVPVTRPECFCFVSQSWTRAIVKNMSPWLDGFPITENDIFRNVKKTQLRNEGIFIEWQKDALLFTWCRSKKRGHGSSKVFVFKFLLSLQQLHSPSSWLKMGAVLEEGFLGGDSVRFQWTTISKKKTKTLSEWLAQHLTSCATSGGSYILPLGASSWW